MRTRRSRGALQGSTHRDDGVDDDDDNVRNCGYDGSDDIAYSGDDGALILTSENGLLGSS